VTVLAELNFWDSYLPQRMGFKISNTLTFSQTQFPSSNGNLDKMYLKLHEGGKWATKRSPIRSLHVLVSLFLRCQMHSDLILTECSQGWPWNAGVLQSTVFARLLEPLQCILSSCFVFLPWEILSTSLKSLGGVSPPPNQATSLNTLRDKIVKLDSWNITGKQFL
jgi:hypothetical protein